MAIDTVSMEDIIASASRLGINLNDGNWESINLPTGQDFGIKSDDEDLNEEDSLEFEGGFGNIIVVDNLPVVPKEKFEKLEGVVRKIYSQIGVIKDDGLWMPVDPATQKTLGYCFIEYNTSQEAELAKEKTNGYKLDRAHIFAVNMFDEIEKFMKVPDEWAPPETKPYTPGENLQHWLTDEKARDQFVIRAGSDTEVLWNDARQLKADPVYKRNFWTESYVQWSPLGTYLATVHRQGAAVWGGASTFNRLMRYAHPQVKLIDFSPGEKYLVTYSSHEPSNPRDTHKVVLNIFDVRTGKIMRDFKGSADDFAIGGSGGFAGVSWPVFRWGGGKDDKYFARMGKNVISVYETETFALIDKKSIKVENVMDFSWSPTDPIFALFVPELGGGNQPARVSLIQIPGKEELRQKNLFSVSDCKMYWQSNGDYLAVKVDRYTKTKKSTYTGFELFRIKERDIPIEVLELENKNDKIIAFAWEPKGHRFAVIHGDNPRPDISFYSMRSGTNTGRVSKLTTLKGKQANALFWSPGGRFIILAGLKGFNGQLEFYNVDDLETMATAEHFMATDIEWDPTGRYVATAVTSVHEMENGFNIWSFHGKLLYRIMKDHFFQLQLAYDGDPVCAIVNEIYSELNVKHGDIAYLRDRAILTPLNEYVEVINREALKRLPGKSKIYTSCDTICKGSATSHATETLYPTEYLNSLKFSGMPNHQIELKIGAPIMLLRNLNPKKGLCNGTRLIVTQCYPFLIEAVIITGNKIGDTTYIPRITMTPADTTYPFVLKRKQFPVALCYAMTINKTQGQTMKNVGLYLPDPVFSHDQLYVAISRVTSPRGLKIICANEDQTINGYTKNVVYQEIFGDITWLQKL